MQGLKFTEKRCTAITRSSHFQPPVTCGALYKKRKTAASLLICILAVIKWVMCDMIHYYMKYFN